MPVNIIGLAWGIYCVTFLPFPPFLPVTSETMNYAGPIMAGVICLALGEWFTFGHKRFVLPHEEL
jgi:choline transport protein